MYKPAQGQVATRLRALVRALYKRAVRYEPVYVLPWVACNGVSTTVLLDNNQIEYSRRRRGMSAATTVAVTRHDATGRTVLERTYDVRPGKPVTLDVVSDSRQLECGFYRMTDSSQYYVQVCGPEWCALTHGRSTTIAHYDSVAGALLRGVLQVVRPHRKGLNLVCSADTYQTVVLFNLSSAPNVISISTRFGGDPSTMERLTLPPYGSRVLRFQCHGLTTTQRIGHVRLRASTLFELYVLQTRSAGGRELMSIQHVN